MSIESSPKPLILIGAQDVDFYLLLDYVLGSEGFATVLARKVEEALRLASERQPAAILLDCRSPSFPAAAVSRRLKHLPELQAIPLIALVGPASAREQARVLKLGVDDSFSGPLLPAKLAEYLRTRLGLARHLPGEAMVSYADIEMSLGTYRVRRNGRDIHLSPTEFRLLRHLLQHPEQAITRDELAGAVWQEGAYVSPRTVDVHMGRLRKALKSAAPKDLICTVRSVGYALLDQPGENGTQDE
jgi:two-component system phosphate regulon response regulator PhoB